ncbi:hypothetical protein NVP1193O_115 [Vibrio phage 1.193.O._10N.286.52.C6]|nr:hypothetical protein NVP1193O_115 [Vibrio phage 1.193.O._10N.286.52.C6]
MKNHHYDYEIVSKTPVAYFYHWEGEIRKVRIIDCDFDKRVTMFCLDTGETFDYKWGYVYNTFEEATKAKHYHEDFLDIDSGKWLAGCPDCINPWKLLLSNKDYAQYKKIKRKLELAQNKWYVAVDDEAYYNSKHFKTQKAALSYFRKLDSKTIEYAALGEDNIHGNLLEFEDDEIWWIPDGTHGKFGKGKDRRTLKSRHFGKNSTYKQWRK